MAVSLGQRIRRRRLDLGYTQVDAALRAGMSYRIWRRLESEGKASIDDLMRAAVARRCEQNFAGLFPEPAATSMDMLLKQQTATAAAAAKRRQRAPSRKSITRASSSIDTSSSG
jgi:transcriptional regulator with XRE-family HTH domain